MTVQTTGYERTHAHLQEDNCISTASGIVTLETSELSKLLKYISLLYYINVRRW